MRQARFSVGLLPVGNEEASAERAQRERRPQEKGDAASPAMVRLGEAHAEHRSAMQYSAASANLGVIAPLLLRSNTESVTAVRDRVQKGATCPTRRGERGFTLVELMTVVMIAGVLAAIAFASLRQHVSAAWGAEALNMVQSIRGAEERWRSEHMMYFDVSTDEAWFPRDPRTAPAGSRQAFYYDAADETHGDNGNWLQLRPTAPGSVRFGYLVNAGTAGSTMTPAAPPGPAATWPTPPTDNWYVIQAIGDPDGDGVVSYYRASSLDGDVFAVNHGE